MSRSVELDGEALGRFLDATFGRGEISLGKISGGQSNPTFWVTHGGRRLILRKRPAGHILSGAHAIDREYRVMKALAETDVPVPGTVLFHEDASLLGTSFYLMEHVEGRIFDRGALPHLTPAERHAVCMSMAETLARLHRIVPADVGLADYGRPGNYFARQIARWTRQWRESPGRVIAEIGEVAGWLHAHMPPDDGIIAIAHGDFRLGFCCMPWRTAPDEYGGLPGLDTAGLGIPDEAVFISRYQQTLPHGPALLPFHRAFALFRFAVIFAGVADRACRGNTTSEDAAAVGGLARAVACRALEAAGLRPAR